MFQANLTRSSLGVGTLPAPSPDSSIPSPSARSQYGLDILNFFIADVQTGFGPFLAVYLTVHGWTHGMIGSVLTASTAAAVVSQTPAGMLVDWTRAKRAVVAAGLFMTGASAILLALVPR
jgi:MFS family permease